MAGTAPGAQRRRNRRVVIGLLVLIAPMLGLVAYSPTLYRMFCAATGFGGTVRQAGAGVAAPVAPVEGRTVTVAFDANVGQGLPWAFRPAQRKVEVRLGEVATIYYEARNNADHAVVGHAVFNVTPYVAAPYFFKIQCFCFTDERLGPGETARMPVELFVDPELLNDPNARDVSRITLSYTFYAQDDVPADTARDLAAGSTALDGAPKADGRMPFDNDAPRR